MTVLDFIGKKERAEPISMVTSYDSWSASLISQTDIDCVLVGDSVAMTLYGYDTSLHVDTDTIASHTAAVRRAMPGKFLIADMPFLSYRKELGNTMNNVEKLMKAGANAIKLEGAAGNTDTIHHIVESGVPVMGHLGLTPQSVFQLGGHKVQARTDEAAKLLGDQAIALERAGCFSLVLEAIPSDTAALVARTLAIPVIGIGAGPGVDGQVLVLQDLLGITMSIKPKFVRQWLDGSHLITEALNEYHREVVARTFPTAKESYT
ncbi:MAG: 3-methyl-2-oxobutanoate hydroxymethyltransferase [Spirochaetales bacterium]|jgi:3-methyl-2-oxobutanoate hydroxymethyltransferase|nr:3-methyl-2-oxobutanoate hydroxymethyltransferase [Spirochaetales bacterium]